MLPAEREKIARDMALVMYDLQGASLVTVARHALAVAEQAIREACAKIADAERENAADDSQLATAYRVAAAIRNQKGDAP